MSPVHSFLHTYTFFNLVSNKCKELFAFHFEKIESSCETVKRLDGYKGCKHLFSYDKVHSVGHCNKIYYEYI